MSASSDPFTPTADNRTSPYINIRLNTEQRQALNKMKAETGDITDSAVIKRAIGSLYRELYSQKAPTYRGDTPQED
jgi:hypothetical protein